MAVGGHACTLPGRPRWAAWADRRRDRTSADRAAGRDRPRRHRHRRRPQRAGHRGLPGPRRAAHARPRGPPDRRRHGRRRESFAGARVNICNCDHMTFRTTPVIDELELAEHGLRYVDMEPRGTAVAWSGGPAWQHHHDVGRTIDELAATYPDEVDGYRRYLRGGPTGRRADPRRGDRAAVGHRADPPRAAPAPGRRADDPALEPAQRGRRDALVLHARRASSARARDRADGVGHLARRRPGTGLGALSYAMRHVGRVGRPVGGSGALTEALAAAVAAPAATVRCDAPVAAIRCDGGRVAGVTLADGTEIVGVDRRVGVRPAAHVRRSGCATHRPRRRRWSTRWRGARSRAGLRVEDRRRARS